LDDDPDHGLIPYWRRSGSFHVQLERLGGDHWIMVDFRQPGHRHGLPSLAHPSWVQDTEVEIFFLDRIRDERKFPSVEDLRAQIGKDIARAQRYLRRLAAPSFPEKELSK